MEMWPSDDFEKWVSDSLRNSLPGPIPDIKFLSQLYQGLQAKLDKQYRFNTWVNGIRTGLVASVCGIIFFLALNILPQLFVDAAIVDTGFIEESIMNVAINQKILWKNLFIDFIIFQ